MKISRQLLKTIPVPEFTASRLSRRANMAEQDRAIFYYSNLFCIAVTVLPIAYLLKANYWNSESQMFLHHVLGRSSSEIFESTSKRVDWRP